MEQLVKIVIKRLENKGIDTNLIPSFIRDVANAGIYSDLNLNELNRRLGALGWDGFELDDHTFQQIEAIIENKCFSSRIGVKECMMSGDFSIPGLFQVSLPSTPM